MTTVTVTSTQEMIKTGMPYFHIFHHVLDTLFHPLRFEGHSLDQSQTSLYPLPLRLRHIKGRPKQSTTEWKWLVCTVA